MKNSLNTRGIDLSGASVAWVGSTGSRERFGIAPYASVHGTGLPFAGTAMAAALAQDTVRPDADGIPRPRGRQR